MVGEDRDLLSKCGVEDGGGGGLPQGVVVAVWGVGEGILVGKRVMTSAFGASISPVMCPVGKSPFTCNGFDVCS